jgi:hypothetical protein
MHGIGVDAGECVAGQRAAVEFIRAAAVEREQLGAQGRREGSVLVGTNRDGLRQVGEDGITPSSEVPDIRPM